MLITASPCSSTDTRFIIFGAFDIGEGIEPGETATLVWDESTDDGNCEQWIKAVFDDGESSPAKKFDFCEENLVLEFN
ncbi:MAG: hypothetical protein ACR2G4_01295 [Pyrinomonadaceae bacterium]